MALYILVLLSVIGASLSANTTVPFSNSSNAEFFPSSSTIYLSPPVTPTKSSCTYDCSYSEWRYDASTWKKISLSTVTEAVVYHIINNYTNATSAVTSYFTLTDSPKRWNPPTNSAGTQVATKVAGDKTTTIAYPTPYASGTYTWWGEIPITTNGVEICTSALWAWTPYSFVLTEDLTTKTPHGWCKLVAGTWTGCSAVTQGSPTTYVQAPTAQVSIQTDAEDPQGFFYVLDSASGGRGLLPGYSDEIIGNCVRTALPENPCKKSDQTSSCFAPIAEMRTALYLTVTSTFYESKVPPRTSSAPTTQQISIKLPVETSTNSPVTTIQSEYISEVTRASTVSAPPEEATIPPTLSPVQSEETSPSPTSQDSQRTILESSEVLTSGTTANPLPTPETSAGQTIEPISNDGTSEASNGAVPTTVAQTSSFPATTSIPVAVISVITDPSASTPLPVDITVSWNDQSEAIIGTQTLLPGSSGVVGSGPSTTLVVLHTSGSATQLEIGSTTYDVPVPTQAPAPVDIPVFITNSEDISHASVGDQTLQPGSSPFYGSGEATTAAVQQSVANSNEAITHGSTIATLNVQQAEASSLSQTLLAGIPVSSNSQSQLLVGTQTLNPGSSITVGSGATTTIVALHTSNSITQLVAGDETITIPDTIPTQISAGVPTTASEITLGGITISNAEQSHVVLGTQTLALGSSVTLGSGSSTTVFALETSGSATHLIAGSNTVALESNGFGVTTSAELVSVTPVVPVVLSGITVSQDSQSHFLVGSQTISPGSTVTITSGSMDQVVAVQTSNGVTEVVIGTVTRTVTPLPGSRSASSVSGASTIHPNSSNSGGDRSSSTRVLESASSSSASSSATKTSNAGARCADAGMRSVLFMMECLFIAGGIFV